MQKMTVNPVACAVVAALALGAHSAYADGAEKEIAAAEPSIGLPSVKAGAFYRSMKIERGMVENKESVFGYEAEIEWYGFFLGIESCYDMTNVEGRRGRYNEIESEAGYSFSLGDFTAKAAYVYKACGGDGQGRTRDSRLEPGRAPLGHGRDDVSHGRRRRQLAQRGFLIVFEPQRRCFPGSPAA